MAVPPAGITLQSDLFMAVTLGAWCGSAEQVQLGPTGGPLREVQYLQMSHHGASGMDRGEISLPAR